MVLGSALEADMNLGSLLPARCCRKAHVSTGSYSYSSSDSYMVIKSPCDLCRRVFLAVILLLGIGGVIAGGCVSGMVLVWVPKL